MPIADSYQKQIKQKLMMGQSVPESPPEKLMADSGKTAVDFSDTLANKWLFLYHNDLLSFLFSVLWFSIFKTGFHQNILQNNTDFPLCL